MKINLPKQGQVAERSGTVKQGGVYISPNLKRVSVMLNRNGDQIDPRTKQIIKRNTNE